MKSQSRSLTVQGLSKNYGGVKALKDVDLHIPAGDIHGIIGPNGAGKSTLVDIVSGFSQRSAGEVLLGHDKLQGRPYAIARAGVSRTFQHTSLFHEETVIGNLETAHASMARGFNGKWRGVALEELETILELVGLDHFAHDKADSLPYGAQRRLAIAIALVAEPDILLLDEPAAGMNPVESEEFVALVRKLNEKCTIALIEHDMNVIRSLCSNSTVLVDGQVLASGPTQEVLEDPRVVDVYLGAI